MRGRFAAVPTAALVDVLDDLGRREQTLPPSIRPLAAGMRVAGRAFTVEGRPSDHGDWDGAIRKTLRMLGEVPAEHVAVYQCHHERSAHFGELSATSLARRGVAGCVIDGGCRDVRLIEALELPVFTRFVTPEDSTWRWEVTATQRRSRSGPSVSSPATGSSVTRTESSSSRRASPRTSWSRPRRR